MIKKKKNLLLVFILLILEIIILFNSNVLIVSTKEALNLFINKLFISLFPFFVLNKILINYNLQGYLNSLKTNFICKLLNINNTGLTIIILSLLSGMPANAEYIKDALKNNIIDYQEAEKILLISFFPSPVFVITVIGYMSFNSILIGISILLCVYLSNLILGILIRNKYEKNKDNFQLQNNLNKNFMTIFKEAISSSFDSLLVILGNIIVFSLLLGLINNYFDFNIIVNSIISSLLELTNAIKKVSEITNFNLKISLTLFALLFSGSSIIFQSSSILGNQNINFKKVFLYRLFLAISISSCSYFVLNLLNH